MLEKKRFIAIGIAVMVVAFGMLTLSGCKKSEPEPEIVNSEPEPVDLGKAFADAGVELDDEMKAAVKEAESRTEQTVCPIMGNKINKDVFC